MLFRKISRKQKEKKEEEIELFIQCIRSANNNFFQVLKEAYREGRWAKRLENDMIVRIKQGIKVPSIFVLDEISSSLDNLELKATGIYKNYLLDVKRAFPMERTSLEYAEKAMCLCDLEARCYDVVTGKYRFKPQLDCLAEIHAVRATRRNLEIELGLQNYAEDKQLTSKWEPLRLLYEAMSKRLAICDECPFKDHYKRDA